MNIMEREAAAKVAGAWACSGCKSDDRRILHNVYLRKVIRLHCTSCVLNLNLKLFCPVCFSLHNRPGNYPATPSDLWGTLVCFKCKSVSHATCVAPNTPKSPYFCPFCLNPNAKHYELYKSSQYVDLKSSKALRTATMIAMNSLEKAADEARVKAERIAKEAVVAREKAKDALDRVAGLWSMKTERHRRSDS